MKEKWPVREGRILNTEEKRDREVKKGITQGQAEQCQGSPVIPSTST
jgi:hypothetical protein